MQTKLKLVALGATALLALVAISAVILTPGAAGDDGEQAEVEVTDAATVMEGKRNLTVTVTGKVNGTMAPLRGAEVWLYSVTFTSEGNRSVAVIEVVAQGLTDQDGNVTFSVDGNRTRRYCVMAEHGEVVGFAKCDLSEGECAQVIAHQWHADTEHGKAWKKLLVRYAEQNSSEIA